MKRGFVPFSRKRNRKSVSLASRIRGLQKALRLTAAGTRRFAHSRALGLRPLAASAMCNKKAGKGFLYLFSLDIIQKTVYSNIQY